MKDSTKTLVLVRHAHRDNSQRELDNGLTEKGKRQAEALLKSLKDKDYPLEKFHLIASPKRRCIETLQPIARAFNKKIEIDPLLLESTDADESYSKFRKRIKLFIENWRVDSRSFVLICSHGDWLPLAVELLVGGSVEFKKGGWAEISLSEDKAVLVFRN